MIIPEKGLAAMKLTEILGYYTQANHKFETCIAQIGSKTEAQYKNGDTAPNKRDQNHLLQQEIFALKGQEEKLQTQLKTPSAETNHLIPTAEKATSIQHRSASPFKISD